MGKKFNSVNKRYDCLEADTIHKGASVLHMQMCSKARIIVFCMDLTTDNQLSKRAHLQILQLLLKTIFSGSGNLDLGVVGAFRV